MIHENDPGRYLCPESVRDHHDPAGDAVVTMYYNGAFYVCPHPRNQALRDDMEMALHSGQFISTRNVRVRSADLPSSMGCIGQPRAWVTIRPDMAEMDACLERAERRDQTPSPVIMWPLIGLVLLALAGLALAGCTPWHTERTSEGKCVVEIGTSLGAMDVDARGRWYNAMAARGCRFELRDNPVSADAMLPWFWHTTCWQPGTVLSLHTAGYAGIVPAPEVTARILAVMPPELRRWFHEHLHDAHPLRIIDVPAEQIFPDRGCQNS